MENPIRYSQGPNWEKRSKNRKSSSEILQREGVTFTAHNKEAHLVVMHNGHTVDFWPGTGKFIFRNSNISGRGVFNMLKRLGGKR